jgi:tetratricopeptide (TPR) repeat protein
MLLQQNLPEVPPMNWLVQMMGLGLAFCLCLSIRAAEPPKKPDLTKYKEFALRVQKLVHEDKREELANCFDDKVFLERAFHNLRLPDYVRESHEESIKGKKLAHSLANQFCETVQRDGSSYTLMRVRMVEGQPRALFLLIINHNALNYNDLVLAMDAAGALRVVDVYVALSGEFASESVRRITGLLAGRDPKKAEQWKEDKELLKHADRFYSFMENTRTGRYREALKEWDSLPSALRKVKPTALMHVIATEGLIDENEKDYEKAFDDFRKAFPDDPALDLVSLNTLLRKHKFRAYQQSLDHIELVYGRDPYLDVLRAHGLVQDGKPDESKKIAQRTIKDEPDLIEGHWMLITISLRTREHKETARLLTDIEKRFKIKLKDLRDIKEYSHFVKSPEYKEWMERRK